MGTNEFKAASADEIKKVRAKHGITQKVAARIMGVSERTWRRFEERGGMSKPEWVYFQHRELWDDS
jgi:DNA-binding transcriptional regulator YiaG